ncbi:hypothetical protein HY523_02615 [Candidatus Berkelbacteria bacterium]|nr:hypothetical protein [Candidatus Berkelbacteria bacterium]
MVYDTFVLKPRTRWRRTHGRRRAVRIFTGRELDQLELRQERRGRTRRPNKMRVCWTASSPIKAVTPAPAAPIQSYSHRPQPAVTIAIVSVAIPEPPRTRRGWQDPLPAADTRCGMPMGAYTVPTSGMTGRIR